jgi:hypothetical protein
MVQNLSAAQIFRIDIGMVKIIPGEAKRHTFRVNPKNPGSYGHVVRVVL